MQFPAAVQKYRDLRERYYGRAIYDFGEESLLNVAGDIERAGGDDQAVLRFFNLNLAFFPNSFETYSRMAGFYRRRGDTKSALENLQKAQAIEPDNPRIQRQIDRLKSGN